MCVRSDVVVVEKAEMDGGNNLVAALVSLSRGRLGHLFFALSASDNNHV
jgi:hypothetical protein